MAVAGFGSDIISCELTRRGMRRGAAEADVAQQRRSQERVSVVTRSVCRRSSIEDSFIPRHHIHNYKFNARLNDSEMPGLTVMSCPVRHQNPSHTIARRTIHSDTFPDTV